MSSEILAPSHSHHHTCKDHTKTNRLKKFVMHNIGNQDSNILGKEVTNRINRNKTQDLSYVMRIGNMQAKLEDAF